MASTSPRRSGDPPSPSSPLLPSPPSPSGGGGSLGRLSGLRGAARFIRRTGSRRLMREPSVAVRETAAEHLEERQTDWAYSKPVVVLDVLWNLAFVAVAAAVLAASTDERPLVPLRAWLAGYVVQCLLHVLCVVVEYKRRTTPTHGGGGADQEGAGDGDFKLSVVKHLESANTMFSFIWWIVGFYWISAGGQALSHDAPQLYWLTIVFLAFDVFFVVFCVALACVIGIAVCCCLPCIIAMLYAVTDQEGASEEDINNLSKYKFRTMGDADKLVAGIAAPVGGVMTECGTSPPVEHILSAEDADGLPQLMLLTGQDGGASLPSGCTMRILVHLGGEPLIALVDSGATHNMIALDVANRFSLRVTRACVQVTIANGTSMHSKGICRNIRLSIGSNIFAISSYVAHIPGIDVILGAPWLESLGAIMWNFSTGVMRFRYNDRDIELNGMMDGVEEDVTIPQFLSSPSLTKITPLKAGLFNDIRREVRSELELNAMLDGIQNGDHGYPWEVVDGIIYYNNRIYFPLWSPILAHILNGVHQLGGFELLDDIAIGIHEPSSSPSTRSFPASILLPQAIPQKSIQTCNVIMADYFGTEFLNVSGVIWQPPSTFVGPSRMFLDDSVMHTFFGLCIDDAYGHDGVHTTYPTFLIFVNVFCRESKRRPFFASPPREDTIFNYVRIESKDITASWKPIPSSLCIRPRFALEGQIGTLGFRLQLRIYSDTNNIYQHIHIGELQTVVWAMDYSIKFQGRVLIGTKLEDELCKNEDGFGKEAGLAKQPADHNFPIASFHSLELKG